MDGNQRKGGTAEKKRRNSQLCRANLLKKKPGKILDIDFTLQITKEIFKKRFLQTLRVRRIEYPWCVSMKSFLDPKIIC
jgi:hypothetical protein